MSVRRRLAARWSRRDWLAVGVLALTTAFLVGTTLVVTATGGAVADQAAAFDTDASVRVTDAPPSALDLDADDGGDGEERIVLPLAEVSVGGREVTVVGVPPGTPRTVPGGSFPWAVARLPAPPPPESAWGPVGTPRERRLGGASVTVRPQPNRTILPPWWYVANASAVDALGPTGAVVVDPGPPARGGVPPDGTALVGAVAYLLTGARGLARVLLLVTAGSGLLVGVVCHSVTRMTVRDRRRAVFVVRATGAGPWTVRGLFAARAGAITLVGVALGYAVGTVVVNAGLTAAVAAGAPTTLSPRVAGAAGTLLPGLLALIVVGTGAGALAALSATRGPPARVLDGRAGRSGGTVAALAARSGFAPRLLRARAFVPAAAALATFAAVALLTVGLGTALAPLAAPGGGSVVEAGAHHPLASEVDAGTAVALRGQGVAASPEILAPQVRDGRPYLVRGAEWPAFANVSGAALVAGRAPREPTEALVGADLAATTAIAPGDRLTLGGGTAPAVARVRVVGTYRAPGYLDDGLLVGLPVAAHLSDLRDGRVHFVRTRGFDAAGDGTGSDGTGSDGMDGDGATGDGGDDEALVVTDLAAPGRAPANASVTATATVRYYGARATKRRVTVRFGDRAFERRVRLRPGTATVDVTVPTGPPGRYRLRVAGRSRTVRVVDPRAPRLAALPARAPPGATLVVGVTDPGGAPLANATVTLGGQRARTGAAGTARLPVPSPGEYAVTARAGGQSVSRPLAVVAGARRRLVANLSVRPATVVLGDRPTARLSLANPWNRTVERRIGASVAGRTVLDRPVALAPGERRVVSARLPRATDTGRYEAVASVGGVETTASYRVEGDDRLASALARSGYRAGAPVGQGIDRIVGNLQLMQLLVVALAGLTVVGGVAAALARAVHARRRAVGVRRATGAGPLGVLATVLADAAALGSLATAAALAAALLALAALDAAGLLVLFGVRVGAVPGPLVALAVGGAGLALVLASAALASVGLLRAPPAALLSDGPEEER